jgi:hypothetical protein
MYIKFIKFSISVFYLKHIYIYGNESNQKTVISMFLIAINKRKFPFSVTSVFPINMYTKTELIYIYGK